MSDYVLRLGRHSLRLGDRVEPLPHLHRAREIVESLDTLLEAVCLRLGEDLDRGPLLQSMAATLAIDGREACLPLAALNFADPLRRELTAQATDIGKTIVIWATQANEAGVARSRVPRQEIETLELRSRCEGHLWTAEATALLTGTRGGPVVMQLYNEWLHQLVLLRDALLPFDNWDQVPLPFDFRGKRWLRGIEPARETFLVSFLTRISTHASIVAFARALFEPARSRTSPPEGDLYGFQTELGLVLPSVIGHPDLDRSPRGSLTWHPALVESPRPGHILAFRYALSDYFAAPRSALGPASIGALDERAAIVAESTGEDSATLWLEIAADRLTYRIDLGQCLRGLRFAYRPSSGGAPTAPEAIEHHDAGAVLGADGLVTAPDGVHVIDTGGDPLLILALLGKIYPENVVLAANEPWSEVLTAGKNYGAKFVLRTDRSIAGDDLAFAHDVGEGPHGGVEHRAEG